MSNLRIEANGVPIYVQLRDQLLAAIQSGQLKPGDQMPTMRQLAVVLKIDLNTVRRAYDELERRGAVVLARGRGSFVAENTPDAPALASPEAVDSIARQAVAAAARLHIDPRLIAQRIAALAVETETAP